MRFVLQWVSGAALLAVVPVAIMGTGAWIFIPVWVGVGLVAAVIARRGRRPEGTDR